MDAAQNKPNSSNHVSPEGDLQAKHLLKKGI
jgi:hypothetical protein